MLFRIARTLLLAGLLFLVPAVLTGQSAKRPLNHEDYATWRSIQSPSLSADGRYLAYVLSAQEADGEFVVRHLDTGKELRHPRGYRAAVASAPTRGGRSPAPRTASPFSPDGRFALFLIDPSRPDRTKGKTPPSDTSLGILELSTNQLNRIDRVRSFQLPEEGPNVVAYLRGKAVPAAAPQPDKTAGPRLKRSTTPSANTPTTPTTPRVLSGELVLRNLSDGQERSFANVTEYSLSRDGQLLVYVATDSREPTLSESKTSAAGVYVVSTTSNLPPIVLRSGPGQYSRLTWDEKQTQLAFFHSQPAVGQPAGTRATVRLMYWKRPEKLASGLPVPMPMPGLTPGSTLAAAGHLPAAVELVPAGKPAVQDGLIISEQGGLSFSLDGNRLFHSLIAPQPPATPAQPGEEKAVLELWHYNDDFIQPMQKVRLEGQRNRSFRAVFHLQDRQWRQLEDNTLTSVQTPAEGDWALGTDDRPYRRLVGSEEAGTPSDSLAIHLRSGERRPLFQKSLFGTTLSPAGKYALSFDGKDWHCVSLADGKRTNLTAKLGVCFAQEQHDIPSTPPPYGLAGWTKGDTHVLLYDRYDIWQLALDGSSARNLTGSLGRKTSTSLRVVQLDPRQRAINPAEPLLVRAENERTRDTGFYRVPFAGSPQLLLMAARNYSTPIRAKSGDKLLLTVSTFYDYPDLYLADCDFREVRRVSDANPQKANFIWGKAELLRYKSADGLPLQGVLIKPENFDPNRKYPLLVYIYERLSQELHRFRPPGPGTSINPTYYASNGYVVLMPDIAYTVGYPGQSAVKCVLPAIAAAVEQGGIDENAIGIQGHSWGGYQTAYLITQTTRFKAAAAGAPVSNMTSAYGGIRWGTGLPRQFQYEKTQSRIGGSLWQYPTRFLENSPLFAADRVQTPLLMLHNDRDEAVPWQQGIEYYLALRRLGKEVYLFNYPGEFHGLRQRVNQKDYTVRMQQFFDHHLKGAAKPDWMAKGIPYTPPPPGRATPTPAAEPADE